MWSSHLVKSFDYEFVLFVIIHRYGNDDESIQCSVRAFTEDFTGNMTVNEYSIKKCNANWLSSVHILSTYV